MNKDLNIELIGTCTSCWQQVYAHHESSCCETPKILLASETNPSYANNLEHAMRKEIGFLRIDLLQLRERKDDKIANRDEEITSISKSLMTCIKRASNHDLRVLIKDENIASLIRYALRRFEWRDSD